MKQSEAFLLLKDVNISMQVQYPGNETVYPNSMISCDQVLPESSLHKLLAKRKSYTAQSRSRLIQKQKKNTRVSKNMQGISNL